MKLAIFFWLPSAVRSQTDTTTRGTLHTHQVQAGSSHCLAVSKGGDLYVWGRGDSGQLGLGDRNSKQVPVLNAVFPEGTEIAQAGGSIPCTIHHACAQARGDECKLSCCSSLPRNDSVGAACRDGWPFGLTSGKGLRTRPHSVR